MTRPALRPSLLSLDAAAPFYGIANAQLFQAENFGRKPVLGQFGEADGHKGFSDPDSARALEAALKAAGGEVEIIVHPVRRPRSTPPLDMYDATPPLFRPHAI